MEGDSDTLLSEERQQLLRYAGQAPTRTRWSQILLAAATAVAGVAAVALLTVPHRSRPPLRSTTSDQRAFAQDWGLENLADRVSGAASTLRAGFNQNQPVAYPTAAPAAQLMQPTSSPYGQASSPALQPQPSAATVAATAASPLGSAGGVAASPTVVPAAAAVGETPVVAEDPIAEDGPVIAPDRCTDKESCLLIIDAFLDAQPRNFELLQVRSPKALGGGPCGGRCNIPGPCPEGDAKCRYDTYDSALAALYYVKRGRLAKAKVILDAFIKILYPTNSATFKPNSPKTQHRGVASGRVITLLASSFNKAHAPQPGNYQSPFVTDGGVDTGNNAWAALAFAHYAAATGASCYAAVARDILGAMTTGFADCKASARQGYMGHLPPYTGLYRSVEHNTDLYGLAKVLGDQTVMAQAQAFVKSMFGRNHAFNTTYATGTTDGKRCDDTVAPGYAIAVDATFWNILADADTNVQQINSALRFALQTPGLGKNNHPNAHGLWVTDIDRVYSGSEPHNPRLSGFRFSTAGNGAQWENTAGAIMAMAHYQSKYGAGSYPGLDKYIEESRNSIKTLLTMYKGIPSSVLGGNYPAWQAWTAGQALDPKYPGGSDTGLGWPYLRYLATAPTAWAGLMLLYQADSSQPVDEESNPYAAPSKAVPSGSETTCIPPGAMRAQ